MRVSFFSSSLTTYSIVDAYFIFINICLFKTSQICSIYFLEIIYIICLNSYSLNTRNSNSIFDFSKSFGVWRPVKADRQYDLDQNDNLSYSLTYLDKTYSKSTWRSASCKSNSDKTNFVLTVSLFTVPGWFLR